MTKHSISPYGFRLPRPCHTFLIVCLTACWSFCISPALSQIYVDQAADFEPPNPTNGATVTWKPGATNEVAGLIFGTNAFSSVQSAVSAADFGLTVFVASGLYHEGSRINVAVDLTIRGEGADATFLSGSNTYGVLLLTSGRELMLEDISIVNGLTTDTSSAGIQNGGGDLILVNCAVTGNHATGSTSLGGGLANNGTAIISNSVISGNSASRGGGIHSSGSSTLTIINSTVSDNETTSFGGGINVVSGTVTIQNSTISGNIGNQNSSSSVHGGGMALHGGTINIRNSTISGNSVLRDDGGGIWNNGALTIIQSTITGNKATGTGGAGGGVFNGSTLIVGNSIVASNTALSAHDISGSYSKTGVNFIVHDSGFSTGSGTNLTYGIGQTITNVINTNLVNNGGPTWTHRLVAGSPAIDVANSSIATAFGLTTDQRGTVRIYGSSVDIGSVEIIGPPVFVSSDPPTGSTGLGQQDPIILTFDQLVVSGAGSLLLRRSDNNAVLPSSTDFAGATATITPTAPLPDGVTFYVTIETNAVLNIDEAAFAGISNPTTLVFTVCFSDVYVDAAGDFTPPNPSFGTPVTWNGAQGSVGGLVFGVTAFSNIQNAVDAICDSGTVHIAMGIYQEGSPIVLTKNITLQGDGQGLTQLSGNNVRQVITIPLVIPSVATTVRHLEIRNGLSTNNGGGILLASGSLTVDGVRFQSNVASNSGGAIYISSFGASVTVTDSTFSGNTAVGAGLGGGIAYANGGLVNLTISDSVFTNNVAGYGGGIALTASGTTTVTRCTFDNNDAIGNSAVSGQRTSAGGAIYVVNANASLLMMDSTLSGNAAFVGNGGGLENAGGTVTIINSTISGNTATPGAMSQIAGRGAGIYNNNNGNLTVIHGTIIRNNVNSSSTPGRGIYDNGASTSLTLANTIVAGNLQASTPLDVLGAFTANGVNFIGSLTGATPSGPGTNLTFLADTINDLLNTNLADNGGTTRTHVLKPGSRAIDAGSNGDVPPGLTTDQRGVGRIYGSSVDIGAVEDVPPPVLVSVNPPVGGPHVPQDVEIVLTLDQNVMAGAGSVLLRNSATFATIPSFIGISSNIVTITPISLLPQGQKFYVEIGVNALVNALGNFVAPILNPTTLVFQVRFDDVYVGGGMEGVPGEIVTWDSGSGSVTGLIYLVNAFDAISNAVLAVNASGTVHIAPGTYSEKNITLTRDAHLVGDILFQTRIANPGGIPQFPTLRVETGVVVTMEFLTIRPFITTNFNSAAILNHGTLHVRNSTLIDNHSGTNSGGAIFNNGTLTLVNSTLTENNAGEGSGIYNHGGSVFLTQATVVFNSASKQGGGIFNNAGTVTLVNSIVAANTGGLGSPEIQGSFIGQGANFVGDPTGSSPSGPGSVLTFSGTGTSIEEVLTTVATVNIGPTAVHSPVPGGPAIDAGTNGLVPVGLDRDQAGLPRIYGGTVDLGAVEHAPIEGDDDNDHVPLLLELILGLNHDVADANDPRNLAFHVSTNGEAVITFGLGASAPPGSLLYVERARSLIDIEEGFNPFYAIEFPSRNEYTYDGGTNIASILTTTNNVVIDKLPPDPMSLYRLRAGFIDE